MPIRTATREPRARRARRERGLVLESTRYDVSIRGLLAEVVVTQHYVNPMGESIEAVFNLATPTDATFLELRVRLDGTEHVGVVQPKAQAERRYERAIGAGDGAVLLENPEPGQYVINVGNLRPETEARVVLRYALWLSPMGDEVRLRLPTVLAPRYGTSLVAPHQQHANDFAARHAFTFDAIIEGPLAQSRIACPSHALVLAQGSGGIGLRSENAEMDRDLVLVFEGTEIGSATHVSRGEGTTTAVACVRLPAPARLSRPADVLFLIDGSGSMAGESIDQARAALVEIAAALPHHDRFQLLAFGDSVRAMHHQWCPVTDDSRRELSRLAARLDANLGGTALVGALESCLQSFTPPPRSWIDESESPRDKVLFIVSDGQVDDRRLPAMAERLKAAGVRVFAVAVGAAPVRRTFEPLCEATGGAIEEAFPGEAMAAKVVRHFRRIGGPRWRVAGVDWRASAQWEVLPAGGYAGDTLRLCAGLVGPPLIAPLVTLRDDEGRIVTLSPSLAYASGDAVARMAGRERWAATDAPSGRLEIALRHAVLTPETSCVVVSARDAEQRTDGEPRLLAIPQSLPAGWGGVGRTAASSVGYDGPLAQASEDPSFDADCFGQPIREINEFADIPASLRAPAAAGDDTPETADNRDIGIDLSDWLDLALARVAVGTVLRAQLRTGLASLEDLLEMIPPSWHARLVAFAGQHQLPAEGLVIALIHAQIRCEERGATSRRLDPEVKAALDAARGAWPVPEARADELLARFRLAGLAR